MIARLATLLAAAAVLVSTPAAVAEPPAPPSPIVPSPVQPANIGDLKSEATNYYDSGAYLADLQLAAWPAIPWINEEPHGVDRPAVVFDIDETALVQLGSHQGQRFRPRHRRPVRRVAPGPVRMAGVGSARSSRR